jgi:hypothetical protein
MREEKGVERDAGALTRRVERVDLSRGERQFWEKQFEARQFWEKQLILRCEP